MAAAVDVLEGVTVDHDTQTDCGAVCAKTCTAAARRIIPVDHMMIFLMCSLPLSFVW